MAHTNHVSKLLTVIVSVFLMGYFLESFRIGSALLRDYFQISTQLLPLVFSFSIFVMTWFAYRRSMDSHSLFMGWAFFVIGLFDMYQLLSYPFMPDFITPNSNHKAEIFWGGARLATAILFLASVYIYKDTVPWLRNKYVLFASVIILSFIAFTTGIYLGHLPAMNYPDSTPSPEKMLLLIITSLIILYAGYLYTKRLQAEQKSIVCLIYGFIIVASGNLSYIYYDYAGHLLRAAGYYFVYFALFKSSIEQPYARLAAIEDKLRYATEVNYRSIFDNANDAIITTDLEDRITSWNPGARRLFGWMATEIMGKNLSQLMVPPNLQAERKQIIQDVFSGKLVSGIETVHLRKDGTNIDVSLIISPLRDADQNIIGFSNILRDVTEHKRAEEQIKASLKEKEILLREIHHRVKNNMQIISSLLRLQSGYIKEKKYSDMYKESQSRIISMSLIHEKLYQSRDLTKIDIRDYVKDLVNGLFQSYEVNTRQIALNLSVDNVSLGINSAIPCGLIINELVSNSLKYAFPEGKTGEIKISLRTIDENKIELIVSDNGIGIPKTLDFRKTESWGMRLITILAENQLQGEIDLDRSKGTEFKIRFRDMK